MRHRRKISTGTTKDRESTRSGVDQNRSSNHPKTDTTRIAPSRCVSLLGIVGLAALSMLTPACAHELDTDRTPPTRGSVGEEMFGVICDRVGAQALREDLTGDSFRGICHKAGGTKGQYEDKVDTSKLPAISSDAVDESGKSVSLEKQRSDREKAIGRVEALGRRRADLIRALDATFPGDERVAIKDIDNSDPTKTCDAPKGRGEAKLVDQIADMMGRMGDLYNDGTLPQSTQSLARVVDEFKKSDEAQAAWSRISARNGYRPIETALGAARPMIAYPNLRDFANASLRLMAADSNPYDRNAKHDAEGNRIPTPGPANAAFNKMLEAAHEELLATKIEPKPGALTVTVDPTLGRPILSRPRDNLEIMQEVLFQQDAAFGGGESRFIVRRDSRGYARIAGGAVPSPFVDANKDGLPDVDDVGRFVTANDSLAPSPFPFAGDAAEGIQRDKYGRPLAGSALLYDYIDTSHTFAAQAMIDMKPLAEKGALIDMMGGMYVAMGPRGPQSKTVNGKTIEFEGLKTKESPMLDLVYAMGVLLGDRTMDTTLSMAKDLMATKPNTMARLSGAMIEAFDIAAKHPEAKLPKTATFWDENIDIMAQLVKEPGLMEDLLKALAAPEAGEIGNAMAKFARFKDEITYDKNNINGPTYNVTTKSVSELKTPWDPAAPKTGQNRSALTRFLGLINDTTGVAACNKPNAKVHARLGGLSVTMPPFGDGYAECAVFKIDNMAEFYVDVMAEAWQYDPDTKPNKRGTFYLRNDQLRDGIIGGIGAATTDLMEDSSGITGFVTTGNNKVLTPSPAWLNRLVFFDLKNDDVNDRTKLFIQDLQGEFMGSSVCPERIINDPDPTSPDARPDGKVRGLRNCPNGQWLQQRGANTIFVWEHFGFYRAMKPIVGAFAKHGREDLFVALANATYKHMPGADASADECRLAGGGQCPRSGMNSYEGLLAEAFATDVLPALSELAKALENLPVKRCDAIDPTTKRCTKTTTVSGIDVAAAAARAALDTDYSKTLKLTDRRGAVTGKRNDGTTFPQVTPAVLLANALSGIDEAFDTYEAQNPQDVSERRKGWKEARSALVDQFLGVNGIKSNSSFKNVGVPKMTPVLVDTLRAQLLAHCPKSFTPPYERCTWARDELPKKAEEAMGGPLMNTAVELMDKVRSDDEGKKQMNLLMAYLLDQASKNDALASMLASANDMVQLLRDDENLVPLFHVVASAMGASERDKNGRITKMSLVDAQMSLLARLSGKYYDEKGTEICSKEIDPNQVLAVALGHLVTPIKDGDFKGQTPLEVIIDVVADVNRVDPTQPYEGTLAKEDYASVSDNVVDFLTNKERGLEQFYEVIRQGTK